MGHTGYKELLKYRRVQSAFNKALAICKLSHQTSHFRYALNRRITVANDTRWNSHLRLHQHMLNHYESISKALEDKQKTALVITTTDRENLSNVVKVVLFC